MPAPAGGVKPAATFQQSMMPVEACRRMRRNSGASGIENSLKKQTSNARDLMKAKERGNGAGSKSRNLLERLRDFEKDVLRFMEVVYVPFTNNQGENDLRMTKVQQKISGCFRSMQGTKIFCRVRSYLSTCRKQGMTATQALTLLFEGRSPDFMKKDEA